MLKEEGYVISLKGRKEVNFEEIDSPGTYAELHNFIFLPTYGFNSHKNGVIQLFNKKRGEPKERDVKMIKPYQQLVGMLMQNVLEANIVVDININVRSILKELGEKTGNYYREELNYTTAVNNLKSSIENLMKILKDNERYKIDLVNKK